MRPTGLELTQLYFLVEDWIDQDPVLNLHFHMWPEIPQSARHIDGKQFDTRWILKGPRNICFISPEGVQVMDPIVGPDDQTGSPWKVLNHADPRFFDELRKYLMSFV